MKASVLIQREVIDPRDFLDYATYRTATTHPLGDVIPEHLHINISWIHANGSVLVSPVIIMEPMTPDEFKEWNEVTKARAGLSLLYNFGLNSDDIGPWWDYDGIR